MTTIETRVVIGADRKLTVQLPPEVTTGEHHVVVVIEDHKPPAARPPLDLPAIDVGPWPEGLSLRREDIYGDDGR